MYNTPLQADSDRDPKITKVQTEQSAEVQAGHTRVQIKEKPKRRVTRLNYLRDYA